MLDIFRGLKSLVKISHIQIDSPVFRLHYSITVMMLIAFSLIVTTRQYVGNPIDCVHTKDIPEDVLNTYCWIHSTYALKSMFLKKTGKEVPYPGVGNSEGKHDDRKIYRYYQWVCFCLFFQVMPWMVSNVKSDAIKSSINHRDKLPECNKDHPSRPNKCIHPKMTAPQI